MGHAGAHVSMQGFRAGGQITPCMRWGERALGCLTLPRAPLEYFSRCSSKSKILSGGTHWNAESGKKETRKVPGCFIARASSVALSGSTIWPAQSSLNPLSLHHTSALG
jgi:hypothetical protein